MKKHIFIIAAAVSVCFNAFSAGLDSRLPKVNIAGQEYYVYEVKKGDSMYGIANRFGWNIDHLSQLNPTLGHKLEKGTKVYYPASVEPATSSADNNFELLDSYPVIRHIVKKGDSVYSIARMYDVPVELIYTYNPDSRHGLKRGEIITIPQETDAINEGTSFLYYTIRPGDTLHAIAGVYNTSVEQLLRDNKGVSENNFSAGDLLRVAVNSNKDHVVVSDVDETKVERIDTYKVDKNDTWESLSQKTGVPVEELLEANSGTRLKKNVQIAVPIVVTETVEKEIEPVDSREETLEGRRDIYKEVHMLTTSDDSLYSAPSVSVALIIEDPMSKRDNEFTRGIFLALDELKDSPYRIRVKVMEDRRQESDSVAAVKALCDSLDDFKADVVVATYERNFPLWLASYGENNGVEIINAFDVKSELYLDNPSIIHLLTPSAYFSEEVAEWVASALSGRKLVMVGKTDTDDAFAEAVLSRYGRSDVASTPTDSLAEMDLDEDGRYLFYGYPVSREDVAAMLGALSVLKEKYPFADIKVLGRPSWLTLADSMKDQFSKADVYFPSRFFFDHTATPGKAFIAKYSAAYGHGPFRSYPTYAVAGYDIMNYFVPGLASNEGDFNTEVEERQELQTPINIQRVGNWGGFFNPSAYMIRYAPYGDIEKILIRK